MKNTVAISVHPEYLGMGLPENGYCVRYEKEEVSCSMVDLITNWSTVKEGWETACADEIEKCYGEADFIFLPWKPEIWNELYKRGIPFIFVMSENSDDAELLEFEKKQKFNEVGGKSFGATLDMFRQAMDAGYDALSDVLEKHPTYKILLNNVQVLTDVLGKLYERKEEYSFLYTKEV